MITKRIYGLVIALGLASSGLAAQDATITKGRREAKPLVAITQKAVPSGARRLEREYFTWQRTVYRQIDLQHEQNLTLAYHDKAQGSMGYDLTALLFSLAAEGKIKLYEYIDGEEQFDAEHEMSLGSLQERFGLSYATVADAPSREVRSYYVRELHYFDQARSVQGLQVEALCPILYTLGDYGEVPKPLFWVKYSELKPYLNTPRPLSVRNEAVRGTYDDFFTLAMYYGDIVRAQGLGAKSLLEQSASTEDLRQRQTKVEQELQAIKPGLSLPDSIVTRSTRRYKQKSKAQKASSTASKPKAKTTTLSARGLS